MCESAETLNAEEAYNAVATPIRSEGSNRQRRARFSVPSVKVYQQAGLATARCAALLFVLIAFQSNQALCEIHLRPTE